MDFKPRERISGITEMMMMFVAIFFWFVSFIPIVEWGAVPAGWTTMWMWFKIKDADLIQKPGSKGFVSALILRIISFLIGFVPEIGVLLSAFPLVIYTNIRRIKKEDAEFNAEQMKSLEKYQSRIAQRVMEREVSSSESTPRARGRERTMVQ